jgi:hypothetical protein
MKLNDNIVAIAFIFFGILFLLDKFDVISFKFSLVWPVIIIFIGIGFWGAFYNDRKRYGYTMPAAIITVYGLMFLFCTITGWYYMRFLWPGFLIGPGLGFYFLYVLGGKDKGLLIPAIILIGLGFIFLFSTIELFNWWPVILILIGIYLIVRSRVKKMKKES